LRTKFRTTRNGFSTQAPLSENSGNLIVGSTKNLKDELISTEPEEIPCQGQLSERQMSKIDEIMAKRGNPMPAGPTKIDQAVQLSPIENDCVQEKQTLLISDKKCSLAEFLTSNDAKLKVNSQPNVIVDTETCRHAENKFTIGEDGKCMRIGDGTHFIGSNKKESRKSLIRVINNDNGNKENCPLQKKECIVEEVLFSGDDYELGGSTQKPIGSSVDIGTAEFKNPLDNKDSALPTSQPLDSDRNDIINKEKDAHIEILRKLLTKSMKIIKSLRDQIILLTSDCKKSAPKNNTPLSKIEEFLAGEINIGNLEEIGNFLDALKNSTSAENERLLSKKVDILAEKYGDEAKSLAENLVRLTSRTIGSGTNQFISPTKIVQKPEGAINPTNPMDSTLSPILTPAKSPEKHNGTHMSVHNEIMDLYRQAEEEMEKKNIKKPETHPKTSQILKVDKAQKTEVNSLQMTFQQEENENNSSAKKSEILENSGSTSRSIKNWKTFIAENIENSAEPSKQTKNPHNKSVAATGNGKRSKKTYAKSEFENAKEMQIEVKKAQKLEHENREIFDSAQKSEESEKKIKTDHRKLEESIPLQSPVILTTCRSNAQNDTLDENLNHIEAAMSNFLGGFKDLKTELSQIGEAMHSASQIEMQKSPQEIDEN